MQTIVRFLLFWGLNTLALWVVSTFLPGIKFADPKALILAGLVFGLVNTFIKPILVILTLPITLITLGLFILVLNTLILFFVGWLVPGFDVGSFWQVLFAALCVSIVSMILNAVFRRTTPMPHRN